MASDLTGKRAIVIGVVSDAARAVALALAGAGADVALTTQTADAEEAYELRRFSKQISALGRQTMTEVLDLSIGTAVQVTMRQVSKALGGLDIVVIAPDLIPDKASEKIGDAEWSKLVGLNLGAVFFACRSAIRELETEGRDYTGRIIVLLPEVSETAPAAYAALRAGTEALVESLAREWQAKRVMIKGISLAENGDAGETALRLAMEDAT